MSDPPEGNLAAVAALESYALGEGGRIVSAAAERWMPSCTGTSCEEILPAPGSGLAQAVYRLETVRQESITVHAWFVPADPRPFGDVVPIEVIDGRDKENKGWALRWGPCCDLACWVWMDTGRVLTLPFRLLRDTSVALWKEWCHSYPTAEGVGRAEYCYWEWGQVLIPLLDLRAAMAPRATRQWGTQLYDDARFCRMPTCPQSAFYPCKPDRPVWCYRHYDEWKGQPALKLSTTEAIRAKKPVHKPILALPEVPTLKMT